MRWIPRSVWIVLLAVLCWSTAVGLLHLTLAENIAGFWILVVPLTLTVLVTNGIFGRRW